MGDNIQMMEVWETAIYLINFSNNVLYYGE